MSRIGKLPISILPPVSVVIDGSKVQITGPAGSISLVIPQGLSLTQDNGVLQVSAHRSDKPTRSAFGSFRAHLNNAVAGVVTPWVKNVEIRGTGYKFVLSGSRLTISCGFIHPVVFNFPASVVGQLAEDTKLTLTSPDRQLVGQMASNIRKVKPPEPYKGKGIRYTNEFIKLKAGKTAKA